MDTSTSASGSRVARFFSVRFAAPVAALVVAVAALAQPGCADKTCTPSDGDNTAPGPAFECAAGEVCYLGQCIRTCSAGAELSEDCSSDDDCSGARPNCVRSFCSSCGESEACVPTLNICRPVTEVILPEPLTRPDQAPTVASRPLDAGFTPGGVVRGERDAGLIDQPEDVEVTRVTHVDLAREVDYTVSPPVERPLASVRSFDTAIGAGTGLTWRADVDPLRVEIAFPDPSEPGAPQNTSEGDCDLRMLENRIGPLGAPTPADIGDIRMTNPTDFQNSITPELTATFSETQGGYEISPAVSMPSFLRFSTNAPSDPAFVFVSGTPLSGVVAQAWPEVADEGHHVPFALVPSTETTSRLQAGYQIPNPANADLRFRYTRIETGNNSSESVIVRIVGERTELFCSQKEGRNEGGELTVRASILDAFRLNEGATGPTTYNLYFERASREQLSPLVSGDQLVIITVRIRHSLRTSIVFN